jgi:hypothetical protein
MIQVDWTEAKVEINHNRRARHTGIASKNYFEMQVMMKTYRRTRQVFIEQNGVWSEQSAKNERINDVSE